ncbi:hypothetical protein ISR92_00380 [Patescibacteria group bacterium]|nr:hypothetical protein [Patescibacteria group bacterium]
MAFTKKQIELVEKTRRLSFVDFDKIKVSGDGLRIISNLFLNPDCLIDINLEDYIDKEFVLLADISKHILTAAPATLAQYAQEHKKLYLSRDDVIKCFALDHLNTIENNEIIKLKGASYALAHTLSIANIIKIYESEGATIAELEGDNIVYRNVIIPNNLNVVVGNIVWQHFGVVVDKKSKTDDDILLKQADHKYWKDILETVKDRVIDYTDEKIFKKNVYMNIISEIENRRGDNYKQVAGQREIDQAVENNTKINKITFTN